MKASRQIHLVRRPNGVPALSDFAVVEVTTPEPAEGQVLVENVLMSVDPYMRPRLNADQPLDVPMLGTGIGRVVQSRHPNLREGDLVRHSAGMQEFFLSAGEGLQSLAQDPDLPLSVYMHALGGTGITAYGGLLEIGALQEAEQVFVSTAGGAVGSVVAQIAKIKGCYVVGSTGSDDKVAWLRDEVGIDAVINYKTQPIAAALRSVTPNGIDVYFENVGGAHLDAALLRMNPRGRIPVCGMISTYNGGGEGVRNLTSLIYGRIRMQGFVATDFPHLQSAFVEDMTGWLKNGQIKYEETFLDGFERAPEGLIGLFSGLNRGKMLIRVAH
jgi:NADPH-dependent curcumin reductase CurA